MSNVICKFPCKALLKNCWRRDWAAAEIRAQVRTGDTPHVERVAMRKRPPHILVTTPESLYLLLTSTSGRELLSTTRTVIIDEISCCRKQQARRAFDVVTGKIKCAVFASHSTHWLSATQKPIEDIANFLVGEFSKSNQQDIQSGCVIVDSGHVRQRDLQIKLPDAPLEAVMSNDIWQNVYDKLAALIDQHHTP